MKLASTSSLCPKLDNDVLKATVNRHRAQETPMAAKVKTGKPPGLSLTKGKGGRFGGKGKTKGGKGVLPKFLLGRDNTNMDASDGGECPRGWHLCCRNNCFAPHPEKDHDKKK